jgi:putative membrane protein insertion efficiency factor
MWNVLLWPDRLLARATIGLIKIYQATISPDHSALGKADPLKGCKFYPSCSNYGIQALQKYGFITSLPRILWRVLRCHPWSSGGVDHP